MKAIIGKVFKSIVISKEMDEIIFNCTDNETFKMYHEQDCCEDVSIEDINGDITDLIDSPILKAEKVSDIFNTREGTETWTFYKLATVKGYVTIRWYGSSNGYYSEEVSFLKIENNN